MEQQEITKALTSLREEVAKKLVEVAGRNEHEAAETTAQAGYAAIKVLANLLDAPLDS